MEHVAITGLGVISSIGHSVEEFNHSMDEGRVVASPAPWKDGHENIWLSLVEGFDPAEWMEDRVVRNSAPFAHYAIAAAVQAVDDSGLDAFDPLRTAVVIGSALGGVDWYAEDQERLDAEGPDAISPKFMANSLLNMPAAHIALRYGLHGPQLSVATACASSHDAMGIAARMIESGEVDTAIVGGTDRAISPLVFFGARNNKMFTPQPDPYKTCRPFNVERFGVMLGEGARECSCSSAWTTPARGGPRYTGDCGGTRRSQTPTTRRRPNRRGAGNNASWSSRSSARTCPVAPTPWMRWWPTGPERPWAISRSWRR